MLLLRSSWKIIYFSLEVATEVGGAATFHVQLTTSGAAGLAASQCISKRRCDPMYSALLAMAAAMLSPAFIRLTELKVLARNASGKLMKNFPN